MTTTEALKIALLLVLSSAACHCYPLPPAHAKETVCRQTCRTDSGHHLICRTVCH